MGEVWSFLKFCCRRLVFLVCLSLSDCLRPWSSCETFISACGFPFASVLRLRENTETWTEMCSSPGIGGSHSNAPPEDKFASQKTIFSARNSTSSAEMSPDFFFRRRNLFDRFYVEICKYLARCSQAEIRPKCPEGARNSPPFAGFFFGIAETCVAVSRDHGCFRFFATGFAEQKLLLVLIGFG